MKDTRFEENDYLWSREGAVDLEIARLERTLAPLGYQPRVRTRRTFGWMLVAAVAAIACALVWMPGAVPADLGDSGWTVADRGNETLRLRPGTVIETGASESAELHSNELGFVRLAPEGRLRLLPSTGDRQRLALDYGTLRAFIIAPPARFAVDTPATRAVDLGCVYTLQSSKDGNGVLTVEVGWVALQTGDRESFIPAGAQARIRKRSGPGVPVWKDAGVALARAVAQFDEGDAGAMRAVLAAASRPKDALTLWHLLPRVDASSRAVVAARFAEIVSLPDSVDLGDLSALRPAAMDAAWDALDLGETSWWRTWRRNW